MRARSTACSGVVEILLGLDDDAAEAAEAAEARRHVDTCQRCRSELTTGLLVAMRLRRLGADLQHVEPPDDAWPKLRARLVRETPRQEQRELRSTTAAMRAAGWLAVPLLVAALALPRAFQAQDSLDPGPAVQATDGVPVGIAGADPLLGRLRISDIADAGDSEQPASEPASDSADGSPTGDRPQPRAADPSANPGGDVDPARDPAPAGPSTSPTLAPHQSIAR